MLQTSSPRHLAIISIISTSLHMCHAYCQIGRTWHLALTLPTCIEIVGKIYLQRFSKKVRCQKKFTLQKKNDFTLGCWN
jgi:hypothetical protein